MQWTAKTWTNHEVAKIKAWHAEGIEHKEMAARLTRSRGSVEQKISQLIASGEAQRRPRQFRYNNPRAPLVKPLWEEGYTLAEIEEKTKIHRSSISRSLRWLARTGQITRALPDAHASRIAGLVKANAERARRAAQKQHDRTIPHDSHPA